VTLRHAPVLAALTLSVLLSAQALAQTSVPGPTPPTAPALEIRFGGMPQAGGWSQTLNILFLFTLMTLGPALLVSVTSFTRILISLHFLRQALGTQTAPGNQVLIGLALFLTYFIMAPVIEQVQQNAIQPLAAGELDGPAALMEMWPPLRDFMVPQTRTKDLQLFQSLAQLPEVGTPAELKARVVVPAFLISEIKTAFQIGILLYVPFLLLDLIVAAVLLSLGMMQLPPVVISTPLKLILFVVVDGWHLVIGSLVRSVSV
jgi:flagellar biosynthetic protein FliP